jgi:hypothetical protein
MATKAATKKEKGPVFPGKTGPRIFLRGNRAATAATKGNQRQRQG